MVNVDGLPISKSSNNTLWPILVSIFKFNHVFIVGIYYGKKCKPNSSNDFLSDFVQEAKEIVENGIQYEGRNHKVIIKGICADAPAKSFILCVKGHSGYFSCTKCTTGDYMERRVCFPDDNAHLRTDSDFKNHIDNDYHISETILKNIPKLGLVTNIPLDYQHLICLGVTKKLMFLWLSDKIEVRLCYSKVKLISNAIENNVAPFVPLEFQRCPRSLFVYKQWKATEWRQFLLYVGPIVLQSIVSEDIYIHFLTLHVAIRILCTTKYCEQPEFIQYSHQLLQHFVSTFKNIYGVHHISHNIHALLHLANDVSNFGSLDLFSTFKYENYMQQIKKMLRKDDKPLQQIIRRIEESKINDLKTCKCDLEEDHHQIFYEPHNNGPLLNNTCKPQYKSMKFKSCTLIANDSKNQCCSLSNSDIVLIDNFTYHKGYDSHVIVGRKFLNKGNLYTKPCLSSLLGIYVVSKLSKQEIWPVSLIQMKNALYLIPGEHLCYVSFPLIHMDRTEIPTIE